MFGELLSALKTKAFWTSIKTWVIAAISAAIAVITMYLWYVYWCPKSDVNLLFNAYGISNTAGLGGEAPEFRINSITVDDEYIDLSQYKAGKWNYDGTLVVYGADTLEMTLQANRTIEVTLKKGPYMGTGFVQIGSKSEEIDFYSEQDYTQEIVSQKIHRFIRPINLLIACLVFIVLFTLLQITVKTKHFIRLENKLKSLITVLLSHETIRFIVVGGINTLLSYLVYAVSIFVGCHYILAQTLSMVISLIVSFLLHKNFTFKAKGYSFAEILRFLAVYAVSIGLSYALLAILVDLLNFNKYIAGLSPIVICAIISYIGHKKVTFRSISTEKSIDIYSHKTQRFLFVQELVKQGNIRTRRSLLIAIISLTIAILGIVIYYVHLAPTSDVDIILEAYGTQNSDSLGSEFRVNYIMIDDEFFDIDTLAGDNWYFDGGLVTYQEGKIEFTVKSRRIVEVSFKRGTYMGKGYFKVGEVSSTYDFYYKQDMSQYNATYEVHKLFGLTKILLVIAIFLFMYFVLYCLIPKKLGEFWNTCLTKSDIIIVLCIAIGSIVLSTTSLTWPVNGKRLYDQLDVAGYLAKGRGVLNGIAPQAFDLDTKGIFFFSLIALGQALWSPYGVWFVETALRIAGFIFLYLSFREFSSKPISLSAVLFTILYSVSVVQDGTSTETFSLPFACCGLYLFTRYVNRDGLSKPLTILAGITFAAVCLIRLNNTGIFVGGIVFIIVDLIIHKKFLQLLEKSLCFLSGIFIVLIPSLLYYLITGTLKEFIDFSKIYSSSGYLLTNSLFDKYVNYIKMATDSNPFYITIFIITTAALIVSFIRFIVQKNVHKARLSLLYLLFYILSLTFMSISGRSYRHYVVMFTPILGYMFSFVATVLTPRIKKHIVISSALIPVLLFCVYAYKENDLLLTLSTQKQNWGHSTSFLDKFIPAIQMSNYVEANSEKNEKLLILSSFRNGSFPYVVTNIIDRPFYPIMLVDWLEANKDSNQLFNYYYLETGSYLEEKPKYIISTEKLENVEIAKDIMDYYDIVVANPFDDNCALYERKY